MPNHVTQAKIFKKIVDAIQEENRRGHRVQTIYLNAVDLNLITPGSTVDLFGVTLTTSRAVPPAHFCLKNDMQEVRHISREECRSLL